MAKPILPDVWTREERNGTVRAAAVRLMDGPDAVTTAMLSAETGYPRPQILDAIREMRRNDTWPVNIHGWPSVRYLTVKTAHRMEAEKKRPTIEEFVAEVRVYKRGSIVESIRDLRHAGHWRFDFPVGMDLTRHHPGPTNNDPPKPPRYAPFVADLRAWRKRAVATWKEVR